MSALKTPDRYFDGLPGYAFAPRYVDALPSAKGLSMHYVEAGSGQDVFLCLHGNPSWSFIYRKMIPVLAKAGRVIAPDMLGFGRSDKPLDASEHSFEWHRRLLLEFIDHMRLENITLVVQDWGGVFGLTLPMELDGRVKRLVVMNTALATGEGATEGFLRWRTYSNSQPDLDVQRLLKRGEPYISDAEAAGYAAPFPEPRFKAALRAFPNLLPVAIDDPGAATGRRAREWFKSQWQGQAFVAVGATDGVFGVDHMKALAGLIPNAAPPLRVEGAGHFVQEKGDLIAQAALRYFGLA